MAARYPIRVQIPKDMSKRTKLPYVFLREMATKIETYINETMKSEGEVEFNYADISNQTGVDRERVRAFLFPVRGGGGHNGITVYNPNPKHK